MIKLWIVVRLLGYAFPSFFSEIVKSQGAKLLRPNQMHDAWYTDVAGMIPPTLGQNRRATVAADRHNQDCRCMRDKSYASCVFVK